jgi:uncharacterized CHY-type Zn-finger protein
MMSKEIKVKGNDVDKQTRCFHYHSSLDVIAIKFKCCKEYFACFFCHQKNADHTAETWSKDEFETEAVLCGCCRQELKINTYLKCNNICPNCKANFNPGCLKHYHLYFDT